MGFSEIFFFSLASKVDSVDLVPASDALETFFLKLRNPLI